MADDSLLEGMIERASQGETQSIDQLPTGTVIPPSHPLSGRDVPAVTTLDHPTGRAVQEASLAKKNKWRMSEEKRLCYLAENGIEISLGTSQHPLGVEEAKQEIRKAGELLILVDRLLFWFWLCRSRPRPGDGKVFRLLNGSVPVSIEELLEMLGYTKHFKRDEEANRDLRRFSDGYRKEDKDKLSWNIMLLASLYVSSKPSSEIPLEIRGPYITASLSYWDGVHVGYLVNWGDYINTALNSEQQFPALMHMSTQIFLFRRDKERHEILLSLFFVQAFRDQVKVGTLGQPLMVPVEGDPGLTRYPTMEEILREAQITIDKNNLILRFVPRIEEAFTNLVQRGILARADFVSPIDKLQKGHWGAKWLNSPMIIQAPQTLVQEYDGYNIAQMPPALPPGPGKGRRKVPKTNPPA